MTSPSPAADRQVLPPDPGAALDGRVAKRPGHRPGMAALALALIGAGILGCPHGEAAGNSILTLLPAIAGGITAAGVLLLARELTRWPPAPGPRRRLGPLAGLLTPASVRYLLLAATAGLVTLLLTGLPVAGIAAATVAMFAAKLCSGAPRRRQIARIASARAALCAAKLRGGAPRRRQIAVSGGLDHWNRPVSGLLTGGLALRDAPLPLAAARGIFAAPGGRLSHRLAFACGTNGPPGNRDATTLIIATDGCGSQISVVCSTPWPTR
jgi:hypothetical protein